MTDEYKEIYRTKSVIISVKDINLGAEIKGKLFKYIMHPDIPELRSVVIITDSEVAIMNNAISKKAKAWLRLSIKYLIQWYRRDYCGGQNE